MDTSSLPTRLTLALKSNNPDFIFDSRLTKAGSIFVALTTGARNGNDFAENAMQNGASFLILSEVPKFGISPDFYLVVPDTLEFVSKLARLKFSKLHAAGVKTIAITGSIGKTTTKEFAAHVLSVHGKVYCTRGNYNNNIGLPFTILNCPMDVAFCILELGMNHAGEIHGLIQIAPCDIRIISSIEEVHTENFPDGIVGVAKAKGEIFETSSERTFAIIPSNLQHKNIALAKVGFRVHEVDVDGIRNYETQNGITSFEYCGRKFLLNYSKPKRWLSNILIGFKILEVLGLELPKSINEFQILDGRGRVFVIKNTTIIDDSYNASPISMIAAIDTIKSYSGSKLAILGDMKELGRISRDRHAEVLKYAIENVDFVITVGDCMMDAVAGLVAQPDSVMSFGNVADLQEFSTQNPDFYFKFSTIIIKGSHSVNLQKFVSFLEISK